MYFSFLFYDLDPNWIARFYLPFLEKCEMYLPFFLSCNNPPQSFIERSTADKCTYQPRDELRVTPHEAIFIQLRILTWLRRISIASSHCMHQKAKTIFSLNSWNFRLNSIFICNNKQSSRSCDSFHFKVLNFTHILYFIRIRSKARDRKNQ